MPSRMTVVFVSPLFATASLIFWLWLVFVPASMADICPEGTDCKEVNFFVLHNVPYISTRVTDNRYVKSFRKFITVLERDSFVSMTELVILTVHKCELRTIKLGAFNGLTKLQRLPIESNEISEIKPGTFQNLNSLKILELIMNRLEHLECGVFSGLVKLKIINLAGNKIQYLHPDTFSGLVNLNVVYLGANKLQYLHADTFLGLPKLREINVRLNRGLRIPTDRNFINAPSLSSLDISFCNISSLSVETFANVSALERLGLSGNNLKTVDINILRALPKLSRLSLYGNPLQCDCQLQEVWRLWQDRNNDTVFVVCDTPSEVKGLGWWVLEKGECVDGIIQYYGDYKTEKMPLY